MPRGRRGTKKAAGSKLAGGQHAEAILWVAEQLDGEAGPPEESDAPSRAAWSLYQWASSDPKNQAQFWTGMFKGVALKEKPEASKSMTDDQRNQFRIFDSLERERPELLNVDFPRRTDTRVDPESGTVPAVECVGVAEAPTVPACDTASAVEISA